MKRLAMLVVFMVSWKSVGSRVINYNVTKSPEENKGACEVVVKEGAQQFDSLSDAKKAAEAIKGSGQAIDVKIWKMDEAK